MMALVLAALGAAGSALASPQQPISNDGHRLLIGGIGEDERDVMREEAGAYNLWLVPAP